MYKLNVYSIHMFNGIMAKKHYLPDGSNLPDDIAIISICEPPENRGTFDYPNRFFIEDTNSISNIDCDDIDGDAYYWKNNERCGPDNLYIIHQNQILNH